MDIGERLDRIEEVLENQTPYHYHAFRVATKTLEGSVHRGQITSTRMFDDEKDAEEYGGDNSWECRRPECFDALLIAGYISLSIATVDR